mmetsp:Transcript_26177/g.42553  ORF Transcript_26177/g.42553 Transcript_26177/m.42553 type:complete len:165 (+) Transcript_26177:215-709(+)
MSSKDSYKLLLLGGSLVGCMMTFFLPYNALNGPSIQSLIIHPGENSRFCNTFRLKFKEQCSGDVNDDNCDNIREDISDCLSTVKAAYEEINYKCLKRNAIYQTCTMSCDGDESSEDGNKGDSHSEDDSNECHKMCGSKKNELLDCEERIVQKWLRKEGMDDWHT